MMKIIYTFLVLSTAIKTFSYDKCVLTKTLENKTELIPIRSSVIKRYFEMNKKHVLKIWNNSIQKKKILNQIIKKIESKEYEVYVSIKQNFEQNGSFYSGDFLEIDIYEIRGCQKVYSNLKIAQYFNPDLKGVSHDFFKEKYRVDSLYRKPFISSVFDISDKIKSLNSSGFNFKGKSLFLVIRSSRPFITVRHNTPSELVNSSFNYIGESFHFVSEKEVINVNSFKRRRLLCGRHCLSFVLDDNDEIPQNLFDKSRELMLLNSMDGHFDINASVQDLHTIYRPGFFLINNDMPYFLLGNTQKLRKEKLLERLSKVNRSFYKKILSQSNLIF